MNQNQLVQLNQTSNINEIFNQLINSYIPMEVESNQLPPPIEEEVLTDYFITKYGLTLEQLNRDLALCREREGHEQ